MPDWYNLFYGIWVSPSKVSFHSKMWNIYVFLLYWLSQSFNRHFNVHKLNVNSVELLTWIEKVIFRFFFPPFSAYFTLCHKNFECKLSKANPFSPFCKYFMSNFEWVASTRVDWNQLTTLWKNGLKKLWFFFCLCSITNTFGKDTSLKHYTRLGMLCRRKSEQKVAISGQEQRQN